MDVELFTTTPQSVQFEKHEYLKELKRIVHQSEKHGYKGILVYSDNRLTDPWMLTGLILEESQHLVPMIALQPVYMHPYTVAKKIATIALMYDRPIALNLVAGGFVNDLKALGDQTPHDDRYERLCEYTEIIQLLLTSKKAISYSGKYYQVDKLKLQPEVPEDLQPLYYLSGSSLSAQKSAARLGAQLIEYPEPISNYSGKNGHSEYLIKGIRIGILARDSHEQAWIDAHEQFPATRSGEIAHQMARQTSDSEWHKKLSGQKEQQVAVQQKKEITKKPVYWLGPFEHYHTFCPYLVGDFDEVANELVRYLDAGCVTCILDIPVQELDLSNTKKVFEQAHAQLEQVV